MRVLGQLANIHPALSARVAEGLGLKEKIAPTQAAIPTRTDLAPSPALSILAKAEPTLKGRMIGILVADGTDAKTVRSLIHAAEAEGAKAKIIAPMVGGATGADGAVIEADFQLAGGPSVLFDSVAIVLSAKGATTLAQEAAAVAFVHDAYQHLKTIGFSADAQPLLDQAGVVADAAVVNLAKDHAAAFVKAASKGKLFERETRVRTVF
jgi:catalase